MSVCVPICSIRPPFMTTIRSEIGERLGLVMGDVDGGLAGPPLEVEDRVLERVAQVLVERGQRLVEQQDARDRWPGHAPARPAAAARRTAGRAGARRSRSARPSIASRRRARRSRSLLDTLDRQPEGDVVGDRQVREEGRGLEHEADVPLAGRQPRHVLVVEQDPPAASARSGRRSSAAWSSCRSRTGPAASRTRRRRRRGRSRRRRRSWPKCLRTRSSRTVDIR